MGDPSGRCTAPRAAGRCSRSPDGSRLPPLPPAGAHQRRPARRPLRVRPAVGVRPARPRRPGAQARAEPACPYSSVAVIGQRAEGVLRFPEAVAVDGGRQRVRGRPAQLRGAEVQHRGRLPGRVGLLRWRARASSARSGPSPPTQPGTCTSSTPATTGSRSSPPAGRSSPPGGTAATASANSTSAHPRTRPSRPDGGIAVAGSHVFVADTLNHRHRALQPRRRRSAAVGQAAEAVPASSLPARAGGQRKRGGGRRRRQPPHPEVQPGRRLGG